MLSGYSMVSLTVSEEVRRGRGVLSGYSMVSLTVRRGGGVCCQVIVW